MRTAMQELLDELDLVKIVDKYNFIMVKYIIDKCLKKEKEQIIDAYSEGYSDGVQEPNPNDEYYDQTYNQNK